MLNFFVDVRDHLVEFIHVRPANEPLKITCICFLISTGLKQDTLRQVFSIVGFSLNKPVPSICVQDLCYIYMSSNIFKHIHIFVFRRERPPFHIFHEEFKGTPFMPPSNGVINQNGPSRSDTHAVFPCLKLIDFLVVKMPFPISSLKLTVCT